MTLIRFACFLAAGTSGAALLAKVYGVTSMRAATLGLAVPCCIALVIAWIWATRAPHKELASMLSLGFIGGLLGTLAYDVVRIPFHLAGQRIFAPIAAYGVWINDASASSRFTDAVGWAYHFSNGITFGIMYALVMQGRRWEWAVAWGLILETIALTSPFARIFSISGNYPAIGIAYVGHVAWGIPLGLVIQHHRAVESFLARIPRALKWSSLALGCAALVAPVFIPRNIERDRAVIPGEFLRDGDRLIPSWQRIQHGGHADIRNPAEDSIWVRVRDRDVRIAPQMSVVIDFPDPGIYQVFVETQRRSRSSFVMVEPVEDR